MTEQDADPPEKSLEHLRTRAEAGDAEMQNTLGFMYAKGFDIPQDYTEAVRWYRKAAEQGNALGQSNLGVMYRDGQGVASAHPWRRRSPFGN